MNRLQLTPRQWLIVCHDLVATAAAFVIAFLVRFEDYRLAARLEWLPTLLPVFLVFAAVVFFMLRLHEAKWRFTSLPELLRIVQAAAVLAVALLVLDYLMVKPGGELFFFGRITIAVYFLLQTSLLVAPRIAYRYFREVRTQRQARDAHAVPTLILGRAADVEVPLRAFESGAIRKIWPVGILSPSLADRGVSVRGVPVLGTFDDLGPVVDLLRGRDVLIARLILTPSALEVGAEALLMQARRLGIATSRMPSLDEGGEALRLVPVAVEDLLLRPSVKIDYTRLEQFIKGKSVAVTGGGGSIGAEICDRVATFGAARLMIIENSEPALYAVTEILAAKGVPVKVEGRLADIRDRERMFRLFDDFKPDIVFHAAALKHVPLLETNWDEGIKTNVFGTANVADAAAAAGAAAMVMISTDKAIDPVSVLGATKRLAEMYCQALDAEQPLRSQADAPIRIISVRFGNVLASNGSVVPKFKAQIEAGGPVTVTHPDMVRYFMTIREACDLVVMAASHALGPERSDVSVYVLNMGQPVRILELAERLIRLSGLEPGRDIEIAFSGTRPGERLQEILFSDEETHREIGIPGIVAAQPGRASREAVGQWLAALQEAIRSGNRQTIDDILGRAVPGFGRSTAENCASGEACLTSTSEAS